MKPQKNFNSIEYWVIIQLKLVLYTRIEKKNKSQKNKHKNCFRFFDSLWEVAPQEFWANHMQKKVS